MANQSLISESRLQQFLLEHPDWKVKDHELYRTFELPTFDAAIAFVDRVADTAQHLDHHPDIDIRYKKVTLHLTTHKAGGLTDKDPELAAECDKLLDTLQAGNSHGAYPQ